MRVDSPLSHGLHTFPALSGAKAPSSEQLQREANRVNSGPEQNSLVHAGIELTT